VWINDSASVKQRYQPIGTLQRDLGVNLGRMSLSVSNGILIKIRSKVTKTLVIAVSVVTQIKEFLVAGLVRQLVDWRRHSGVCQCPLCRFLSLFTRTAVYGCTVYSPPPAALHQAPTKSPQTPADVRPV